MSTRQMNFMEKLLKQDSLFVVAEIGANHNGDMEMARQMIDAAESAGCHAVKFQSWSKESLFSKEFIDQNTQAGDERLGVKSLEEMLDLLSLSCEKHRLLKDYCDQKGILFSSSSFSKGETDLLDALDVPFFKIASMDINHHDLLDYTARKGRPMFLATGMATVEEIKAAVQVVRDAGNDEIVLFHCVSLYPPPDALMNLNNIEMLRDTFQCPVGFSDHSLGFSMALAAVAKGALFIEKHFTLDKKMPGWDHAISADPAEMEILVREAKRIVQGRGAYEREVSADELEKRRAFRRSVVSKQEIREGERITAAMLDFKRPGTGISPDQVHEIIGRKVVKKIGRDQMLKWEDLEPASVESVR